MRLQAPSAKCLITAVLSALCAWSGAASATRLGVLVPVQQDAAVASKPSPAGALRPILQPASTGPVYRALMDESRRGAMAFVLRLDAQAQRRSGQAVQPTWLLLTEEEGGFAQRGFWWRQSGRDHYIDQPYVALLTDAAAISDGGFRIDGVRRNWFIHRQLLPPGADDAAARRANSSAFDVATLKNGNQMLASEGVVATLFYRALLPLLVQSWMATDLSQGQQFLRLFIETALPQATVALARVGRVGDQEAFVEQLKPAREQLAALTVRATREPGLLAAALGPPLRVASSAPLIVNLNIAEADELAALDRSLAECAEKIVAERAAHGAYQSLDELLRRTRLVAPLPQRLGELAAAAAALGTYPRL